MRTSGRLSKSGCDWPGKWVAARACATSSVESTLSPKRAFSAAQPAGPIPSAGARGGGVGGGVRAPRGRRGSSAPPRPRPFGGGRAPGPRQRRQPRQVRRGQQPEHPAGTEVVVVQPQPGQVGQVLGGGEGRRPG